MSYKYFNKYLGSSEEIIEIIYSVKFLLYLRLFIAFILFILPFFLMVPILSLGGKGIILFLLFIILAVVYGVSSYYKWNYNCIVLTKRKLCRCYHKGLFNRMIEEFYLNSINEIIIEYPNFIYRLFKIGDLVIVLKNNKPQHLNKCRGKYVDLNNVKNVVKVKNLILESSN